MKTRTLRRVLACTVLSALASVAQTPAIRLDGGQVRVKFPAAQVLTNRVVERLKSGTSITLVLKLEVLTDRGGKGLTGAQQEFVASYDLWEERFVIRTGKPRQRTVSHLSVDGAESWCWSQLGVDRSILEGRSFWLRFEVRSEIPDNQRNDGSALSGMIDIFSGRRRDEPQRHAFEAGPFRLEDLPKTRP